MSHYKYQDRLLPSKLRVAIALCRLGLGRLLERSGRVALQALELLLALFLCVGSVRGAALVVGCSVGARLGVGLDFGLRRVAALVWGGHDCVRWDGLSVERVSPRAMDMILVRGGGEDNENGGGFRAVVQRGGIVLCGCGMRLRYARSSVPCLATD